MRALAALLAQAGFPAGLPVALARVDRGGAIEQAVAGTWPNGAPVAAGDRFYVASLAKQLTGAALAVLVRDGALDPDVPITFWLSGLPAWSRQITPRHLAHHIAGLPAAGAIEAWPRGRLERSLCSRSPACRLPAPPLPPGTDYVYSNLGYILLARIVAIAAGQPFDKFVDERLLTPLGLAGMGFAQADIRDLPHATLLGPHLPLTHGDGGLWASAPAYAAWLLHQNRDTLGIADLVTAPGRLADGRSVPYGWGVGLRRYRDEPLFIHGGEWTGAVAKAVRCPASGLAVVGMASGVSIQLMVTLVDTALDELASR